MRVNEDKVKKILVELLHLENENLKTKRHSDDKMIDKIKRLIEEEVKRCY